MPDWPLAGKSITVKFIIFLFAIYYSIVMLRLPFNLCWLLFTYKIIDDYTKNRTNIFSKSDKIIYWNEQIPPFYYTTFLMYLLISSPRYFACRTFNCRAPTRGITFFKMFENYFRNKSRCCYVRIMGEIIFC